MYFTSLLALKLVEGRSLVSERTDRRFAKAMLSQAANSRNDSNGRLRRGEPGWMTN
jgi:hypothetical protein